MGNSIEKMVCGHKLANDLFVYSYANCIGIEEPCNGDRYIGFGAIVIPCNGIYLPNELRFCKRIKKYIDERLYNFKWYGVLDIANLNCDWGFLIEKTDHIKPKAVMFNLAKEFLPSMDQFRCIYVETYSEIKTVSILDAAAIADLYIEAIDAVVKERKDAIERGNK